MIVPCRAVLCFESRSLTSYVTRQVNGIPSCWLWFLLDVTRTPGFCSLVLCCRATIILCTRRNLVGIEKATDPFGDCIIAYEMNGVPIPRDHGFPLRVIVPGYAAVRNVKWVEKIEVSQEEAEGPWQRGLNYKVLPPSVVDANEVDVEQMTSVTETSVYSGITTIARSTTESLNPGDRTTVRVGGWAYAGGGRNIVRVDVTGDNGKHWATATLKEGTGQRFHHAWAWTFWECELPVVIQEDGTVHVASKAVDMAFNVQPEKSDHTWNVRGLGNNSWYRAHARVA